MILVPIPSGHILVTTRTYRDDCGRLSALRTLDYGP